MISKFLKELKYTKETINNGENINRIYYPCCGLDIGVDLVFSDTCILHLDCNERIVRFLRKKGYLSFWGKFENFYLKNNYFDYCDAMVLFDQVIEDKNKIYEAIKRNLKRKGYVVCDNTCNAAYLMKNFGFDLLFVLMDGKENYTIDLKDWEERELKRNLNRDLYEKLLKISKKYGYDSVEHMKKKILNEVPNTDVIKDIETILKNYGINKPPISFLRKLSNQRPNAFYVFKAK